ncbi:hypothetical protein [Streptomyces sp. TLI_185]|uniref:hypothetical protein n=1 Tax=Streptomyces sp. TLI_185 TaxID=2485151 RepID=UPI000F4FB2B5|nr:hypothetical protein [Streptomyces sp. TLI_185]
MGDRTGSLLSPASGAVPAPRSPTSVALAGVVGLLGGLLLVTLLEVLRPRVAGRHAFARELDTPMLGRLPGSRHRARRTGPRRGGRLRRRDGRRAPPSRGPHQSGNAARQPTQGAQVVAGGDRRAQRGLDDPFDAGLGGEAEQPAEAAVPAAVAGAPAWTAGVCLLLLPPVWALPDPQPAALPQPPA